MKFGGSGTAELRKPRERRSKQTGLSNSEGSESGEDEEGVLSLGNRKRKAKDVEALGVTQKRHKALEGES